MPQATKQRLYTPALKAFTAYRTPAFMTPMSEEERERVLFARSEAKKPKRLFTPLPVKDRQTRLSDEELEDITSYFFFMLPDEYENDISTKILYMSGNGFDFRGEP